MEIIDTKTGRQISALWLIPIVPVFAVGFFFYVVSGLTCMVVAVAILDGSPALSAGPAPVGVDQAFIFGMLRFDRWLVGLAGLSSPWLAIVPGLAAGVVWEWATGS